MVDIRQGVGMTSYRQENGILVYRFQNNRRETVDAWINQAVEDETLIHAEGGVACLLLDLRGHSITPYAIQRVIQTADLTPRGLQEWLALLVGDSFAMRVMEGLIYRFPAATRSAARIFKNEADAMRWLEEKQQAYYAAKKST